MWKMIYRTSFVKLFICVIFIYFLVDNDKIVEVKKEIKEEPLDEDVINVETFDDDPMIIDKPQVQEMFDVQRRKTENLLVNSIKKVHDGSNDDVIKNATNISNIIFDYEYNIPIKKEIKQEIKNEPLDKDNLNVKALDDRKGSRSNDDLDHILGKKDRNWLHF